MSPIEIIASALGVLAVWLTIRENIWGWPVGLVMVLLYTWIFFDAKLYANAGLQLVFAGAQLYGWRQWSAGGEAAPLPIRALSGAALLIGVSAASLLSVLLAFALGRYTDGASPWQDGTLSAFSLLAQYWMAHKIRACWPLWLLLDSLYVGLFIDSQLYLTAALYGLFCLLAAQGWWQWHKASQ